MRYLILRKCTLSPQPICSPFSSPLVKLFFFFFSFVQTNFWLEEMSLFGCSHQYCCTCSFLCTQWQPNYTIHTTKQDLTATNCSGVAWHKNTGFCIMKKCSGDEEGESEKADTRLVHFSSNNQVSFFFFKEKTLLLELTWKKLFKCGVLLPTINKAGLVKKLRVWAVQALQNKRSSPCWFPPPLPAAQELVARLLFLLQLLYLTLAEPFPSRRSLSPELAHWDFHWYFNVCSKLSFICL